MATPNSATELFDQLMPQAIAKSPDKAKEVGAVYVFNITADKDKDNGGSWTVDLKSNTPSISKGVLPGANCTITVAHEDFIRLLAKPADGMGMFMQGKLKVTGDPMLAMKLQKLFDLA